jgi:hypothetical protein
MAADTPKVPMPEPCRPEPPVMSSSYDTWLKRIQGKEIDLEKKGGK